MKMQNIYFDKNSSLWATVERYGLCAFFAIVGHMKHARVLYVISANKYLCTYCVPYIKILTDILLIKCVAYFRTISY